MLLLVYYLDSIIVCLLNGYTSMYLQEPTMVFTHMYWVFVFILFKEAVKSKNLSAKTFTRIFSILIIVCFVLFCRYYMTNQSEKYSLTGLNVVYYLLFMFPILLMSNDKKIVTVGVVLNLIAVLLSGKRGALIAIVAALVIWRQSDLNYKSSKEKMLKMLFAIAVGVVAVYGVLEIVERLDLDILDRMQSLLAGEDSGGSGRTDIWETYWEHMKTDSPWKNLIGRGYSAAKRNPSYRGLGLGWAHNDFLQILFDYGIIGLGIFVSIIVKLFAIARRMKAVQYRYYAPFLSSLVIFVLCCCFSMVTMLPQWILPQGLSPNCPTG